MSSYIYPLRTVIKTETIKGLTNLAVRREGIKISRGNGGLIEDCTFKGVGGNIPPHLPAGIKILAKVKGWTIRRVTASNFTMALGPGYDNGDGGSDERGCDGITWEECTFNDNTDGGFDLKGTNERLTRCTAARNFRNIRIWGNAHLSDCITESPRDPNGSHLFFAISAGGDCLVERHAFKGSGTHVHIETGKAGQVITLTDPTVDGKPVTDMAQLRILKSGSGKLVTVSLQRKPAVKTALSATALRDSNKDGKIELSNATADKLNLPHGTILVSPGEKTSDGWIYTVEGR